MVKSFLKNTPAIKMTVVGFGQGGSRMADEFASFKNQEGLSVYNCLALNSNDGDLQGLKYIPKENRVSLHLGGLAKNPKMAIEILEENKQAKEKMYSFIKEKLVMEDDFVLFLAGLGGGTGTATIVKAIEDFFNIYNKPILAKELEKIKQVTSSEEIKQNPKKIINKAIENAIPKYKKIGIIVTLPLRSDGPDVLKQVNEFSQKLWKLANDPSKGIAFITFADNQHFSDEYNRLPNNKKEKVLNYRDYGNKIIADLFHELNAAATSGGADVILDSQDFRRVIMEHQGSLVLSKYDMPIEEVISGNSIIELFKASFAENALHAPIELVKSEDETNIAKKVYHVGLLSIIDGKNEYGGGAFLDDAVDHIIKQLPIRGSTFRGYVNAQNDYNVTAYTFYKMDGLPKRLEKGLVEEYEEYMERNKKFKVEKTTISSIKDEENELDFDLDSIDLDSLGFESLMKNDDAKDQEHDTGPSVDDLLASLDI